MTSKGQSQGWKPGRPAREGSQFRGRVAYAVTQAPALRRALHLVSYFAVTLLNFLIYFDPGTPHLAGPARAPVLSPGHVSCSRRTTAGADRPRPRLPGPGPGDPAQAAPP